MRLLCSLTIILCLVATRYCSAHNSGRWFQLKPSGIPPSGTVYHSAAAVGSTIYICGGSKNHNHTHYYDVDVNKWFEEADASLPHNALAADMDEVGGVLYLFGGKDTTSGKAVGNGHVNDLFTYKTGRNNMKWQKITTAASPLVRDGHATSALKGFVFMFGGWDETHYFNDLHVFDTTKLVATGGAGNIFDLIKWTELKTVPGTPLPAKRNSHSMVAIGSSLIVYGGFSHDVESHGAWVYCDKEEHGCIIYNDIWSLNIPGKLNYQSPNVQWTKLIPGGENGKPQGRWEHTAAVIGDEMYIFGGLNADKELLNDLWAYCHARNEWRRLKDRATGVFGHIMVASGGSLFVFGGNVNIQRASTSALWKYETLLEEDEGDENDDKDNIVPARSVGDDVCFKSKNGNALQTYVTMLFWIVVMFFMSFILFFYIFIKQSVGNSGKTGSRYVELNTKTNTEEKPYTAL